VRSSLVRAATAIFFACAASWLAGCSTAFDVPPRVPATSNDGAGVGPSSVQARVPMPPVAPPAIPNAGGGLGGSPYFSGQDPWGYVLAGVIVFGVVYASGVALTRASDALSQH